MNMIIIWFWGQGLEPQEIVKDKQMAGTLIEQMADLNSRARAKRERVSKSMECFIGRRF